MEAWIIKYALTDGIRKVEGEISKHSPSMLVVKNENEIGRLEYYHGLNKDWCDNEADAIKFAEEKRNRKIESLRKQITKLEKLKFGERSERKP